MVVIVDDATPPTVFTLGKSALPVKSPANLMIPLNSESASVASIYSSVIPPIVAPWPVDIVIPALPTNLFCLLSKKLYSALLIKPASVPV